ncbi:MAG: pitrilysin family protein [Pseudomonadales bacterium]|nr:pitrilysin family protein [Pseudomonadales bacterium]
MSKQTKTTKTSMATDTTTQPRYNRKTLNLVVFGLIAVIALLSLTGPNTDDPSTEANGPGQIAATEHISPDINLNWQSPEVHHWVNEAGARVYFVASEQLPMLDIRMIFNAGSARDDATPGIARLTNATLAAGTNTLNATEVAAGFEQVGAQFGLGAHRDMALLRLRSLSELNHLMPALDLLANLVSAPRFPEDAVVRDKNQMLANIKHSLQQPGSIASKAFYQALYPQHPYAIPGEGSVDSIPQIQPVDLKKFHQQYYVSQNLTIALVGAISLNQAKQIANRLTRDLPAGSAAAPLPEPPPGTALKKHIEFDSNQTHILVGTTAIKRDNPDRVALILGNEILGGGALTSLLGKEIRQKRGLSYSVNSQFIPMQSQGPFQISLQTRNDQTTEALTAIHQVLTQFIDHGPTQEQLADAKRQLIGYSLFGNASNAGIVSQLGSVGFYQLPIESVFKTEREIQAVTLEQIKTAFQHYLDPEQLVIITVGASTHEAIPSHSSE